MLSASQLYGGKISTAFASTRRRWSMTEKEAGSNSLGRSHRCCTAIRKSCGDISGRCYLFTDRKKLSQDAATCCGKPFQNVNTHHLGSSDCTTEPPCDSKEELHDLMDVIADEKTLEKGCSINSLSDSVFQPSNQLPLQNVKRELIKLSLPAVASQAIDPLAQLMETAYIGKLGPIELASAGVSMSIFNIILKLFNLPLLSVATSIVAEDIAKSSAEGGQELKREKLSSVSTALLLALGFGIFQALALLFGTGSFLSLMGVSLDSPMREPAKRFLSFRAIGAPAVVLSLALQAVLRGFKDTKSLAFCLGAANLVAVIMFPLLINYFQMGITGAAAAIVVSQYIGCFLMVWHVSKKVLLSPPKLGDLKFGVYLKSGGLLIGRMLSVMITMTIGTSVAARQGPQAMAAHQICKQVWLAASLLTDALASSGQALVASSLSTSDYDTVKQLTGFVLKIGIATGATLALILSLSFGSLATLFTKDYAVLQTVKSGTLFVSASQPLNCLAFIFDGLHYGASDFNYAAYSAMLVGAISSAVQLYASSVIGLPGVWLGLTLFMGLRVAAGFFRCF